MSEDVRVIVEYLRDRASEVEAEQRNQPYSGSSAKACRQRPYRAEDVLLECAKTIEGRFS